MYVWFLVSLEQSLDLVTGEGQSSAGWSLG